MNAVPKREHSLGGGKTLKLKSDPTAPGVVGVLCVFGATMGVIDFTPEKVQALITDLQDCLKESQS